jgi:hypothetical protein
MPLILSELIDKLKREDEVTLLELLAIDAEMILERFADLVEEKMDYLEGMTDD